MVVEEKKSKNELVGMSKATGYEARRGENSPPYRIKSMLMYAIFVSIFSISLGSSLVTLDEIFSLALEGRNYYSWPNPNLLYLGTRRYLISISLWPSWEIVFIWIIVSTLGLAVSFGLLFFNLRKALDSRN